jgi:hypothetical protein
MLESHLIYQYWDLNGRGGNLVVTLVDIFNVVIYYLLKPDHALYVISILKLEFIFLISFISIFKQYKVSLI